MGNGDPDLIKDVKTLVPARKVMIAGIHDPTDYEKKFLTDHDIAMISPEQLKMSDQPVLQWIKIKISNILLSTLTLMSSIFISFMRY